MNGQPPGVYDQLVTEALARVLDASTAAKVESLPASRAANVLAWHVYERTRALLSDIVGQDASVRQLAFANRVLQALAGPDAGEAVSGPARLLTLVHSTGPFQASSLRPRFCLSERERSWSTAPET